MEEVISMTREQLISENAKLREVLRSVAELLGDALEEAEECLNESEE
jgi:hypothetical protein